MRIFESHDKVLDCEHNGISFIETSDIFMAEDHFFFVVTDGI